MKIQENLIKTSGDIKKKQNHNLWHAGFDKN
jgi:hypothetical protein